jgi:hypothetical protein
MSRFDRVYRRKIEWPALVAAEVWVSAGLGNSPHKFSNYIHEYFLWSLYLLEV